MVHTATIFRRRMPLLVTGLLLALLGVLATLQWQWIGELSAAERRRMLSNLEGLADRFADDFDRELVRAVWQFHPPLLRPASESAGWLAERWSAWQAEAPFPDLVRALVRVRGLEHPDCFLPAQAAFANCGDARLLRDAEEVVAGLRRRRGSSPGKQFKALLSPEQGKKLQQLEAERPRLRGPDGPGMPPER